MPMWHFFFFSSVASQVDVHQSSFVPLVLLLLTSLYKMLINGVQLDLHSVTKYLHAVVSCTVLIGLHSFFKTFFKTNINYVLNSCICNLYMSYVSALTAVSIPELYIALNIFLTS